MRIEKHSWSLLNPQSAIGLPFRELEALARALLSVLLAFFDARVARDEPRMLQGRAQVGVEFDERARDAVADRAGLACWPASIHVDENVKLVRRLGQLQRLADNHAQRLVRKILLEGFAIDLDFARARPQIDARRRSLAPTCSVILNLSHSFSCPLNLSLFLVGAGGDGERLR